MAELFFEIFISEIDSVLIILQRVAYDMSICPLYKGH